eukprot:TRINITY_DN68176_c0_g1_i1.p1 TRINITY_DN68176_c0_g1~~TRINITY_DN68176_c0_g1_i1.p1  ORF type:complete len:1133 (+),score=206.57 TRINITY_DN68176_c0_g1_i1:80-3478(+)
MNPSAMRSPMNSRGSWPNSPNGTSILALRGEVRPKLLSRFDSYSGSLAGRGRPGVVLPKLKSPPSFAVRSNLMQEPTGATQTKSQRTSSSPLLLGAPPQHLVTLLRGSKGEAAANGTTVQREMRPMGMSAGVSGSGAAVGDAMRSPARLTPLSRPSSSSGVGCPAANEAVPTLTLPVGSKLKDSQILSQGVESPSCNNQLTVSWVEDRNQVDVVDIVSSPRPSDVSPVTPESPNRYRSMSSAVSDIARQICCDLDMVSRRVERRVAWDDYDPELAIAINDPVLRRARQVFAASNAKPTDEQLRPGRSEDTAFLREMFLETRQVRETLNEAMDELWRANVRMTEANERESADEDRDGGHDNDAPHEIGPSASSTLERGVLNEITQAGGSRPATPTIATVELVEDIEIEGVPDLKERLARVGAVDSGLSEDDMSRLRSAFGRFREQSGTDLHKDRLSDLLGYLGHVFTDGSGISNIYKDITPYEFLDFGEFVNFMDKYLAYEHAEFKNAYEQFDKSGDGEMSKEDVRCFMTDLRILPFRSRFEYAWNTVDPSGIGLLDFFGLLRFLAVFTHCEGFNKHETMQLRKAYDTCCDDKGKLPLDSLCDALVRVFGVQLEEASNQISEKMVAVQGSQAEGLMFDEFLILARRAREIQHASVKEEYHERFQKPPSKSDNEPAKGQEAETVDGAAVEEAHSVPQATSLEPKEASNESSRERRSISQKVLTDIIREHYFPLKNVVEEVLDEVLGPMWDSSSELDFIEFFDFMVIYQTRDGFTKAEIDELTQVFDRFDTSGEQEINALQLADIFRFLGYAPSLEQIHLYVRKVDVNGSNALDPREFLQLMQMHRKAELENAHKVFTEHAKRGMLTHQKVLEGLAQLGHTSPEKLMVSPEGSDFDEFVAHVDCCRSIWVAKQRRKTGYNDEEIENFQDMFNKFDKGLTGKIDGKMLNSLLAEFGWSPTSREEQVALLERLDTARQACREAGVEDTSEDGASEVWFWEFIQLARMLQKQHDEKEVEKLTKLSQELRFKPQEVDQFRQAFRDTLQENTETEDARRQLSPRGNKPAPTRLSRDMVRSFLRTLGLRITQELSGKLDEQLKKHETEDHMTDFRGFLILMRWILDTDFAGVNSMGKKSAL